jgi:hypothetical protein
MHWWLSAWASIGFFFHENTSLQGAETLKKLGFRYQFKKRMQQQASSKPLQHQSFPILEFFNLKSIIV